MSNDLTPYTDHTAVRGVSLVWCSVKRLAPSRDKGADDVFLTVDRNLYLNLLERYSRSAAWLKLWQE